MSRHLRPDDLPERGDLAVIDVSFISLRLVLPALIPLLAPGAPVVALVKPQFEVGPARVGKGGIVRDPQARADALAQVSAAAAALGYKVCGETQSPITGQQGQRRVPASPAHALTVILARSMKVLVTGAAGFIGSHFVNACWPGAIGWWAWTTSTHFTPGQ